MTVAWISPRWTVSHRYLTAILLVSLTVIFLTGSLYRTHPFGDRLSRTRDSAFELVLDFDAELDFNLSLPFAEEGPELYNEFRHGPDVPSDLESEMKHEDRPLGAHTYTPDGLLVVNPDGPHPIFQLIHDAEVEWEARLGRASKTLDEAVVEYRRRYRRAPPLGFDKWWAYAVKHRIQLPDEYDEIFEDIEPFWGIDPADLARTQEELESSQGVVTIEKVDGHPRLKLVRSTLPQNMPELQRTADRVLGIIRELEKDLPPLRFTISPHDNPDMLSGWQLTALTREAAAQGKSVFFVTYYIPGNIERSLAALKQADLPTVKKRGWIEACPPDSPARLHPPVLPSPFTAPPFSSSEPKTFIAHHREAMNPCTNPSLLSNHGQFLRHEIGPYPQRTLVPRFSLCATLLHHDIRPPVPYGWAFESDTDPFAAADPEEDWVEEEGAFDGDLSWEHKSDGRLNWRGRTTGIRASPQMPWLHGQRARLISLANAHTGNVSVLPVPKHSGRARAEGVPVGEPESVPLGEINPEWMDLAFAGDPITCDPEECDEMRAMWDFKGLQGTSEEGRYKFILDVDGNGWSGRFKRLLTSNALIFKATIYPEWYTSRIAPWVHYVPIQVSYADLYDAVAFFRMHDELAGRIAKAGREWSRRFWRREDMAAYMYRLLLEYARVSSLDRASMDYVG